MDETSPSLLRLLVPYLKDPFVSRRPIEEALRFADLPSSAVVTGAPRAHVGGVRVNRGVVFVHGVFFGHDGVVAPHDGVGGHGGIAVGIDVESVECMGQRGGCTVTRIVEQSRMTALKVYALKIGRRYTALFHIMRRGSSPISRHHRRKRRFGRGRSSAGGDRTLILLPVRGFGKPSCKRRPLGLLGFHQLRARKSHRSHGLLPLS
jgi:hypothetical protein